MQASDFDHITTSELVAIRDSAERIAIAKLEELGPCELVAAAWLVFRAYSLAVESRQTTRRRRRVAR